MNGLKEGEKYGILFRRQPTTNQEALDFPDGIMYCFFKAAKNKDVFVEFNTLEEILEHLNQPRRLNYAKAQRYETAEIVILKDGERQGPPVQVYELKWV